MTGSGVVTILAAVIGSAPGWAGVILMLRSNRKHLDRQTEDIKAHITQTAAQPAESGREVSA